MSVLTRARAKQDTLRVSWMSGWSFIWSSWWWAFCSSRLSSSRARRIMNKESNGVKGTSFFNLDGVWLFFLSFLKTWLKHVVVFDGVIFIDVIQAFYALFLFHRATIFTELCPTCFAFSNNIFLNTAEFTNRHYTHVFPLRFEPLSGWVFFRSSYPW